MKSMSRRIPNFFKYNNAKVFREIGSGRVPIDGQWHDILNTDLKSGKNVRVKLSFNSVFINEDTSIEAIDETVMNSVHTLYRAGYTRVTLAALVSTVYGNPAMKVHKSQQDLVERSLDKLSKIDVSIDSDVFDIPEAESDGNTSIVSSPLFFADPWTEKGVKDGQNVKGYTLHLDVVSTYAAAIDQVLTINSALRNYTKVPAGCNPEVTFNRISERVIILGDYLLQRVENMRYRHNKIYSDIISFQWYDPKEKREKGLFAALGWLDPERPGWNDFKKDIIKTTRKLLTYFTEVGHIDDFNDYKKLNSTKRKVLCGFQINCGNSKKCHSMSFSEPKKEPITHANKNRPVEQKAPAPPDHVSFQETAFADIPDDDEYTRCCSIEEELPFMC